MQQIADWLENLAQILRVHARGERRRADQVGEHHSDLAALGGVLRMPTLRPFGEGCMSGEAIDTRTCLIRRGSRHGTSERWFG